MKKLQLFGFVGLLALVLATVPVGAFTFEAGDNLGKLFDYSSFYTPNATAPGATANPVLDVVPGDWDQEIFEVTDLYNPPTGVATDKYYSGLSPELTGLTYDLKVGSISQVGSTVTIALVAANRYAAMGYSGGRVDLWENPANAFTPAGSGGYPNDWGYGSATGGSILNPFTVGNYDTFPGSSTSTPQLSGTLVPNGDGTADGEPILLTITLNLATGTGVTDEGYIDVLYNPTGTPFIDQTEDGYTYQLSFFENFVFWDNKSIGSYETTGNPLDNPDTEPVYWDVQSQDPLRFSVLPEPATMSLLGMALVGLGGSVLRRRSK